MIDSLAFNEITCIEVFSIHCWLWISSKFDLRHIFIYHVLHFIDWL